MRAWFWTTRELSFASLTPTFTFHRAKLCDFGLSVKKDNRITGTPFWLAPEYLRGQTQYNSMCDIFSMGIVLYEIYARSDPYKGEDFRDTLRKVCDRRVNKRPGIPGICPPKLADLMKKCWNPDPFFRPTSKDLDSALLDMNMRDAEPLTTEEQLQNKARKERATGDMLYELFPRHVADQLKAGQKVEPEQHEEVTVVFSDIVVSFPPENILKSSLVSVALTADRLSLRSTSPIFRELFRHSRYPRCWIACTWRSTRSPVRITFSRWKPLGSEFICGDIRYQAACARVHY